LNAGRKIHIVSGLFDTPGEVISWGDQVSVKLDKEVPHHPNIRMTFLTLDTKPFVLGSKLTKN
jgi:hypothetical protein